jgi:hypothetical protein
MGVDEPERLFLLLEMAQQVNEHQVLEDIRVIAGMEGVAVTEHRPASVASEGADYNVAMP